MRETDREGDIYTLDTCDVPDVELQTTERRLRSTSVSLIDTFFFSEILDND